LHAVAPLMEFIASAMTLLLDCTGILPIVGSIILEHIEKGNSKAIAAITGHI